MYELRQAGARTYYVDCPAKAGLYVQEDGACILIDSGGDNDAARKINRHIQENGWWLTAILNTHSHADHDGGNSFFVQRTGCRVYAPGAEAAFVRHPILEPSFLYGGFAPKSLRNKFLCAQPSAPEEGLPELPVGFALLPLPGHSFDMVGVRTPDDVVFLADCVNSPEIIEKYHVNFLYDVRQYLATLDTVERMEARLFVPAHAEACTDIRPLAELNRSKVHEIIALLLSLCAEGCTPEGLLKLVFDQYKLRMDFTQYALVGSTLRSYLAYLSDERKLEAVFEDNRLLWKTI